MSQGELFENKHEQIEGEVIECEGKRFVRRSAITDEALAHFQEPYSEEISKEDIFYYIYGLLHSEEYREKYADNLSKQLPRIPRVAKFDDFLKFSQSGRQLGDLHVNYENVPLYSEVVITYDKGNLKVYPDKIEGGLDEDFKVVKMKFPKKDDKSSVIYNNKLAIKNIPLEAYDYVVNGKPAIEWVMETQQVKIHKDSGITNNPNDWALEAMGNPRYPLELLLRVITVSIETQKIVKSLPKLNIYKS